MLDLSDTQIELLRQGRHQLIVDCEQIVGFIACDGPEDALPEALAPVHRLLGDKVRLTEVTVRGLPIKAWVRE